MLSLCEYMFIYVLKHCVYMWYIHICICVQCMCRGQKRSVISGSSLSPCITFDAVFHSHFSSSPNTLNFLVESSVPYWNTFNICTLAIYVNYTFLFLHVLDSCKEVIILLTFNETFLNLLIFLLQIWFNVSLI